MTDPKIGAIAEVDAPGQRTVWRKARASQTNGNCVEIAEWGDRTAVRDSKNPEGPVLSFDPAEWREFLGAN